MNNSSDSPRAAVLFVAYTNDRLACLTVRQLEKHGYPYETRDPEVALESNVILLFTSNGRIGGKYIAHEESNFSGRDIYPPKGCEGAGHRIALKASVTNVNGAAQAIIAVCFPPLRVKKPNQYKAARAIERQKAKRQSASPYMGR